MNDAGRVLLAATEVRAAALLAEKEYLEHWFDDNAYHDMRLQNLRMEADWMEEHAKAVARRQKPLWTLCPLDGPPGAGGQLQASAAGSGGTSGCTVPTVAFHAAE